MPWITDGLCSICILIFAVAHIWGVATTGTLWYLALGAAFFVASVVARARRDRARSRTGRH